MYLLDTCILSEYFAGDAIVIDHIARTPKDQIWISVVNVAEVLQGILSELNAQKDTSRISLLYSRLKMLVRELSKYQVLDFDEKAQQVFAQFPAETRKISVNDRRIASIAKANNMVVVTANLRHFKDLLPEALLQDWTRPS